jgi:broad specificity phosphatase PhoE
MRNLILIKHARPMVDPSVSSEQWRLSDEGREKCRPLADALRGYDFPEIISSGEPKAVETARILGQALSKPTRTFDGLEEHDRRNVPHMESRDFISLVALFFKEPDRLVLGDETADEAYGRFATAVGAVIDESSAGDVAIVTHGTVIALFAQRRAGQDAFGLWRRMGLPSFVALDAATWRVAALRDRL